MCNSNGPWPVFKLGDVVSYRMRVLTEDGEPTDEFVTVTDAAVLATAGFSAFINAPDTRVCCISRCALADGHLLDLEVKPGPGDVVVLPQVAAFASERFNMEFETT